MKKKMVKLKVKMKDGSLREMYIDFSNDDNRLKLQNAMDKGVIIDYDVMR